MLRTGDETPVVPLSARTRFSIVSLIYAGGLGAPARATVGISVDGKVRNRPSNGVGPVDAVFQATNQLLQVEAVLDEYVVHSGHPGSNVPAEVTVQVSVMGRAVTAKGSDPDTVVASAKAYIAALNELLR